MADHTKTHPAIIVAAITVTLAALTAMGSMLGLLPAQAAADDAATTPLIGRAAAPAATVLAAPNATPAPAAPTRVAVPAPKPAAQRSKTAPVAAVAAAAPVPSAPAQSASSNRGHAAAPACADCAVITRVREVARDGEGSGLGAVAGGVVGGIVGNRFGNGSGRDLLTVLGAAGGAFAGHQIEKTQRRSTVQEVTVRFEDGRTQVLTDHNPQWTEGDQVRVRDDRIVAL